jgi:hypothetical protein
MTIQQVLQEIQYTPAHNRVAECLETGEVITPMLWISKVIVSPSAILSTLWITRDR